MFMGFRMYIKGNVSYEEPPLRRSRYRRFKFLRVYRCLWVSWVFIGVWVFMGVYRYLRESMGVRVYRCLWVSWVFIGVWMFMGVYRFLRESMGVHGFSDVNQRQRVL